MDYLPAIISVLGGFVIQGVVLVVTVTWKLAQIEGRIADRLATARSEIDVSISAAHTASRASADGVRQEFGETVNAMQNKIHEFEKWSRDTFVRRDSFINVTREIKEAMAAQSAAANLRLSEIDAKLGRLIERLMKPPA